MKIVLTCSPVLKRPLKDLFNPALFFLIVIIAFFVISSFIWLRLDNSPPAWDQSYHMLLSLKYQRLICGVQNPISMLRNFFLVEHYYPPFFHVSALPIVFLLGFSEDNLIFVNFLYLVLLVISVYGIGKILFNRLVGIIAAGTVFFYPIIYALLREYLIDFALVAMVTSVQYLILKSGGGLKKPWNFLLGIMAGCALLTKPVSIIFFLPSWLFVFFRSFRSKKDFWSLLTALIIMLLISGPWYLSSYQDLIRHNSYVQNFAKTVEQDPGGFTPSILWYTNALKYVLISPILLIFAEIGLFLFLIFDRRWRVFTYLMVWGVIAFFVLVFTPNKDGRYIMPILPIFALFTAGGAYAVKNKSIRNAFYSSIFIVGVIQFYNFSFAPLPFLTKNNNYYSHYPSRENWKIQEIINYIANYAGNKRMIIGILSDLRYFNQSNFALFIELHNFPYTIKRMGDYPVTNEQLQQCDIFIIDAPLVRQEPRGFYRNKFYAEFIKKGSERSGFLKMKEFDLPGNHKAIIFKNKNLGLPGSGTFQKIF